MHPIPGNPGNEQPGQASAGAMVVAAQRAVFGDGVRVFGEFAWFEVDSGKMALSRPIHAAQTPAVRRQLQQIASVRNEVKP
jgi:hypothetical protein